MNIMMIPNTADRGPNGEVLIYSDGSMESTVTINLTAAPLPASGRFVAATPAGAVIRGNIEQTSILTKTFGCVMTPNTQ